MDGMEELKLSNDDIKKSLNILTQTVKDRFDNLEKKIEQDCQAVEEKINANIQQIILVMDEKHKGFDESICKLRDEIQARKLREGELCEIIHENTRTIKTQANKICNLEKSVHSGLQHDRKFNVEIDGIPVNIGDEPSQLEAATVMLLNALNVDCTEADIDAIHRLPSRNSVKPTIVRFRSRKMVENFFKNKVKLKNFNLENIGITGLDVDSAIYIRPSLCPYYRNLAFNCRLLRNDKHIKSVFIGDDGNIKIKLLNDDYVKIRHESDLTDLFSEYHFKFN